MAPSPTLRRLLRETAELSPSSAHPNPAFHAAPVSDANLHEWHFTLLGPPSPSPYAAGLYHGRITLPPTYPLKPPNFRFLTPSGRFDVNREICLSISGFHEETWMPAWGVRTALMALRSFMAEHGAAGQVGGMEASDAVRRRLALESRAWRCRECAGAPSNEEVMREWWDVCREKGVSVEEDMGLEALPEGMAVEAKEPARAAGDDATGDGGAGMEGGVPTDENAPTPAPGEADSPTSPASPTGLPSAPPPRPPATTSRPPRPPPPSRQYRPRHQYSQSAPPATSSRHHRHTSSVATNATQRRPPFAPPFFMQQAETATVDRAIIVLVLALFIMLLKKIFYPAESAFDDYYTLGD